ncbi:NAD(P)H-binding protein [Nonomuraea sp. NPDC050680]|uniref:NAD(P)-dependent oxidoreductase n=1 Tax=Nonomuraea sp. NPDC050680 TaxID=3154630 RepID=UPI00340E8F7A
MSSIAVIGAAGRTGRLIVERSLAAGHRVTAIARRPQALRVAAIARRSQDLHMTGPGLTIRTADILAPGSLQGLLDDHDAVISALGATGRGPTAVYSTGTAEIVSALKPGARLIVISSAGLGVPTGAGPGTRLAARLLHHLMRHTYTDMARMEDLLSNSSLTWTAVRPTRLTDRPATGHPRVSIGATAKVGNQTSRADLAAFALDAIDDPRTYRSAVAVSS